MVVLGGTAQGAHFGFQGAYVVLVPFEEFDEGCESGSRRTVEPVSVCRARGGAKGRAVCRRAARGTRAVCSTLGGLPQLARVRLRGRPGLVPLLELPRERREVRCALSRD